MNNLYEFGTSCDVIIRCPFDTEIGGQFYKAGSPYTILKDVYYNLSYKTQNTNAFSKENILSYRNALPDFINLYNVTLTDKVCNLITTRVDNKMITKVYHAIAVNGIIYLPENNATNIYIVHDGSLIDIDYTVEEDKIIGDFIEQQEYMLIYNVVNQSETFDFETPSHGYLSLEIIGKGNLNKTTSSIYMNFPAVSLISVPLFNLSSGTILSAPLTFECIQRKQDRAYFAIGE